VAAKLLNLVYKVEHTSPHAATIYSSRSKELGEKEIMKKK